MEKILRGVMRYRITSRAEMVKEFRQIRNNPRPEAVFFTCIDSRMIPTRFMEIHVGEMFIVRNAGNVIPNSQYFKNELCSCEPAALELGCIEYDIKEVVVCGHSDCKAMNLLYQLQDPEFASLENRQQSPLKSWLCTHATTSLNRFLEWKKSSMKEPLVFSSEIPSKTFEAYIDPNNEFANEDKLSQINTLQQVSNIASYGFLKSRIGTNNLHIHAFWFDIYTGRIYFFSRSRKHFVIIDESTVEGLIKEAMTAR